MNEYKQQAEAFLEKTGVAITLQGGPAYRKYFEGDTSKRSVFTVVLSKTDGTKKPVTFTFGQSLNKSAPFRAIEPEAYDVLASLDADIPKTHEEFCFAFDYDPDSIKGLRTFEHCRELADKLEAFFTTDELTALVEIQ